MTNEKKEKDIKDNKTIIEPVEAAVSDKEKKSKKEPVKLLIDEDIKIARENTNDPTSVLLFNELILLKNVQEKVLRKMILE